MTDDQLKQKISILEAYIEERGHAWCKAESENKELTRKGESLCQSYGEALMEIASLKERIKELEDKDGTNLQ